MVSIDDIKNLRKKTGVSISECKNALIKSNGDFDQAKIILRQRWLLDFKDKESKQTREGIIAHYIHNGNKLGVLVEILCETDFCCRSQDFQTFARDLAMHIAATNPRWVSNSEVPEDVVGKEKEIALANVDQNKPAVVLEKIAQGRLSKFFKETCLLEQPFVKDQNLTIQDLLGELASKVGEKIVIKKFVRFAVG